MSKVLKASETNKLLQLLICIKVCFNHSYLTLGIIFLSHI